MLSSFSDSTAIIFKKNHLYLKSQFFDLFVKFIAWQILLLSGVVDFTGTLCHKLKALSPDC